MKRVIKSRGATLGMDIDGELVLCEAVRQPAFVCRQAAIVRPFDAGVGHEGDLLLEEHVRRYAGTLRETVERCGWRGCRVVLAAPLEHLVLRHVSLPRMPERALRAVLKVELERRIHLPFDDPVYDFHVERGTADASSEMNVIVVAAPRQEIMPWVRLCAAAGLRPVAVEPSLLGMVRVLAREESEQDDVDVLVSLGLGGVALGVLQGDDLVFMRHIAVRPDDYANGAAGARAAADAYATDVGYELDRSLSFIQYNFLKERQTVRGVTLLDKVGMARRVASILGERVDYPVNLAKLAFIMEKPRKETPSSSDAELTIDPIAELTAAQSGVAVGLAIREVAP